MWQEVRESCRAKAQPDLVLPPTPPPRLPFHSSTAWTPTASSPTACSGTPRDTWMGTTLRCHVGAMVGLWDLGEGWHFPKERGPSSDPSLNLFLVEKQPAASGSAPGLNLVGH